MWPQAPANKMQSEIMKHTVWNVSILLQNVSQLSARRKCLNERLVRHDCDIVMSPGLMGPCLGCVRGGRGQRSQVNLEKVNL